MSLRVVIVDDEKYALQELKYLLNQYSDFEICGEADSGEECIKLVDEQVPDVVFLDIHLNDKNGVDIAHEIRKKHRDIHIVFATAYDNYAVNAFNLDAVDYILKPFEDERIAETVKRLKSRVKPHLLPGVITVWKNDRMVVLDHKDIVYCCTSGNKTEVKSFKGEFTSNLTLATLEQKLQQYSFLRTHKSYLVNLEHIKEIVPWFNYTYMLVMKGYEKDEVPVSRSYMKKFKNVMGID
ncbi:LytTR family DNA-binding domain-containing protein [Caldicoprobacter algeriensis]|uniref:LytR/AlgR family response regulator transcription factor n=1 Tax=Caldicoprobacter algeriensis TaxID=699281 RepID=UPI00207A2D8F|nr:LytTR family DNA-binding domain-containing protein [Caldicoprobacter algeriensis]MCM8900664.1 LytTR family DNA-binding domain-containing protein [Caldicoprobacter algeriensis]